MKVQYLYCHPLPECFHAALLAEALAGLKVAGHDVDLLDLYKEGFDPVMSAEARRNYCDPSRNRLGLEPYIARLQRADALYYSVPNLVLWVAGDAEGIFGSDLPAGCRLRYFRSSECKAAAGQSQGDHWYLNLRSGALDSDLRWGPAPQNRDALSTATSQCARVSCLSALYHMNVASAQKRAAFLARVRTAMAKL
jgi:putative NADPH-quinone reductase